MLNIINIFDYIVVIAHLLMAYGQIGLICFYGQYLMDSYARLNDSIFSSDWYKFPVSMQKTLGMIIAAAQYPVEIRGFGSSSCTRETLKEVNYISNYIVLN